MRRQIIFLLPLSLFFAFEPLTNYGSALNYEPESIQEIKKDLLKIVMARLEAHNVTLDRQSAQELNLIVSRGARVAQPDWGNIEKRTEAQLNAAKLGDAVAARDDNPFGMTAREHTRAKVYKICPCYPFC